MSPTLSRLDLAALNYAIGPDGNAVRVPDGRAALCQPTPKPWHYAGPLKQPPSGRLEDKEQHEIVKLLRAYGCVVYSLSQKRATKQSPGIPDLFLFVPVSIGNAWFEVKIEGGDVRPDQRDFADRCALYGSHYACGDLRAAKDFLVDINLAYYYEGDIEPYRNSLRPEPYA